ncbi:hypothetical protein [Mycolicibacterium stellerae]|uniref:hypothetical protein n=1 Tax=Mycolicibacterium stellerae TaxID=2358193 RepID=UPI000F0AFE8E|nr:hypothetical protein [Mycolicibacterium stellerae]
MMRAGVASLAALTLALAGVVGAAGAHAEPMPPPPCGFTLSPPHVVQVDGVSKVTATITSAVCGVAASPYQSVACVELAGQQGGSCMQGTDSAQAYYAEPYQPGATYASRGRGCGIIVPTLPADNCQILGPITATL